MKIREILNEAADVIYSDVFGVFWKKLDSSLTNIPVVIVEISNYIASSEQIVEEIDSTSWGRAYYFSLKNMKIMSSPRGMNEENERPANRITNAPAAFGTLVELYTTYTLCVALGAQKNIADANIKKYLSRLGTEPLSNGRTLEYYANIAREAGEQLGLLIAAKIRSSADAISSTYRVIHIGAEGGHSDIMVEVNKEVINNEGKVSIILNYSLKSSYAQSGNPSLKIFQPTIASLMNYFYPGISFSDDYRKRIISAKNPAGEFVSIFNSIKETSIPSATNFVCDVLGLKDNLSIYRVHARGGNIDNINLQNISMSKQLIVAYISQNQQNVDISVESRSPKTFRIVLTAPPYVAVKFNASIEGESSRQAGQIRITFRPEY